MKKLVSLLLSLMLLLSFSLAASAEESTATVSILARPYSQTCSMDEMTMFTDAAEAAGVTIDWTEVRTGWDEKKAVTLASNELPDIFLGSLDDSDILANLDAFVDMTDLIAEYAPNIQRMFEEVPDSKVSGTYEGGIYSLPLITAYMPHSYTTLSINKTWLDELGLEIPTTLEEFEACLIAFRDNDCNGNGDTTDEIPLDWPAVQHAHDIYALTGAFGVVDSQSDDMVVLQDGVVSFLFTNDAYYQLTQIVHRWYEEGLITTEIFTNDYTASNALCAQGDTARVGASTGWSLESRFGSYADQYVTIAQLSSGGDNELLWPCATTGLTITSNAVVMTEQCEDKVAAIKLIDQFYTDDFGVQSYYGSFDTGMTTKYEDGTYSINVPTDYASIDEAKYFYSLVNQGVGYFSDRLLALTTAPEELTLRISHDDVYADTRPVDTDIWPSLLKFSAEDSEELTYLKSDILEYVNQKMAEWIVNGGIEEEWDAYLATLEKMGLSEMTEIYQNAYNDYYSAI